jgi:hypothetical protein
MPRRIDVRPIIGATVVFLILGTIIFLAVYFLIIKPPMEAEEARKAALEAELRAKEEALEALKREAVEELSTLEAFGTTQAISDVDSFTSRIEAAESEDEVREIQREVRMAEARENLRQELLSQVTRVTEGVYYSATGGAEKIHSPLLEGLKNTLENDIHAKTSVQELRDYEPVLEDYADNAWRDLHTSVIQGVPGNELMFIRADGRWSYSERMTKEEAANFVSNKSWHVLREVKFAKATVLIPVLDTFDRTPTIGEGSEVKVYIYDMISENLELVFGNARVKHTIYSIEDLGTVEWTYTEEITAGEVCVKREYTIEIGVWETLKAKAAEGVLVEYFPLLFENAPENIFENVLENMELEILKDLYENIPENILQYMDLPTFKDILRAITFKDYGKSVVSGGLQADVADHKISVIYVIEVSDEAAEHIVKAEFHEIDTEDVILVPTV